MSGQEDCLYLTVYSPASASNSSSPLPVMLWIPGGYWVFGSNHYDLYGPMFFLDRDVILVDINHRLGTLGWMSLGIPEAPGNQGVLDAVAALRWVQTNIAAFGGDPDSVTVFGESSGSWSTSYLHLTPLAKGLFHRAILQSGSLLTPFWLYRTRRPAPERLAGRSDAVSRRLHAAGQAGVPPGRQVRGRRQRRQHWRLDQ